MPPVNQAAIASAGIIAVSVAVAAAIAVYESPEIRRMADDLRRRIAIALHSLGDNFDPATNEPRFNRPEDAEGFMHSRSSPNGEGVDADEESRRRQREELMYWNAQRELKEQEKREADGENKEFRHRGASFDDFLTPDVSGDHGTYVFNTGAEWGSGNLVRRRGAEGVRGLNATMYANPFADENGVDDFDQDHDTTPIAPEKEELMTTDIYGATPLDGRTVQSDALSPRPIAQEVLFDFNESRSQTLSTAPAEVAAPSQDPLMERQLDEDEFMTAGQEDRHDAYASIQAWAENTAAPSPGRVSPDPVSFYSPGTVTPAAPVSEPELLSEGQATPADSISVVDHEGEVDYDVMSDDSGDGMATPNSWSEVGSVVSESDAAGVSRA